MAKDFKNSIGRKRLNTLIPDNDPAPQSGMEISNKTAPNLDKSSPSPTLPETVVSTFRINSEKLKTIKAIAFWDRKKIQEVFDEALALYIEAQPKSAVNKAVEEYTKRTQ